MPSIFSRNWHASARQKGALKSRGPFEPKRYWKRVISKDSGYLFYVVLGCAISFCVIGLVAYQHLLHVDFPYQDEWRYVDRLRNLPNTGFLGYLFDGDNGYWMPIYLLAWYLSYAFTHLDIMAMRYAGAVASGLVSLLLCTMLLRRTSERTVPVLLLVICAPFVICSLNFWDTYGLAVSSLVIPLQFGVILLSCWAANCGLQALGSYGWALLCIAGATFATGVYPSGLVLLPAIVAARIIVRPQFDRSLMLLGLGALILFLLYFVPGKAQHASPTISVEVGDFPLIIKAWFALVGNALSSPNDVPMQYLTVALGAAISLGQLVAIIHIFRLPTERREKYLIPIILMLFNAAIYVEILLARLRYPDFEFYPRYAFLMIGGPVSLMFVAAVEYRSVTLNPLIKISTFLLLAIGVFFGDKQSLHIAPYRPHAVSVVRSTMMGLHADPTPNEQQAMYLAPDMVPHVYPGVIFLKEQRLANFRYTDLNALDDTTLQAR